MFCRTYVKSANILSAPVLFHSDLHEGPKCFAVVQYMATIPYQLSYECCPTLGKRYEESLIKLQIFARFHPVVVVVVTGSGCMLAIYWMGEVEEDHMTF